MSHHLYKTLVDYYNNLKKVRGFQAKRRLIIDFWSTSTYTLTNLYSNKWKREIDYVVTIFNTWSFRYWHRNV